MTRMTAVSRESDPFTVPNATPPTNPWRAETSVTRLSSRVITTDPSMLVKPLSSFFFFITFKTEIIGTVFALTSKSSQGVCV